MRDLAEREDRLEPRHRGDLGDKELAARRDLLGQRFVLGRHAARGVADAAILEREAVIGAGVVTTLAEPELQERRIEQIAGEIAGEGPASAIGAFETWGEADDEE